MLCCVTVLVRKSAPIAVAESRLKPQFSSKNEPRCHCRIYQIDKRWKHSAGKSCKVTGKHCIGDGRKEPEVGPRQEDNEDEDKLFPGGRGTGAARKGPSSKEEIDFWQVRMRARTTVVVARALVADGRRRLAHVDP